MLAAFVSVAGTELSDQEKYWIERNNPLGVTLFARNIADIKQVKKLTDELRNVSGREDFLIAIDQEGGRVRRLSGEGVFDVASQYVLGQSAPKVAEIHSRMISQDLHGAGVNFNFAPVLDVAYPTTHPVLKSRCLAQDEQLVADYGKVMINSYIKNGICPCIKHMPGHGRAQTDPHLGLPILDASLQELTKDFYPFEQNHNCPAGMTAHILVKEVDDELPVTLSKKAIDYLIRGKIGFDGLLISDAIEMGALKGTIGEKARQAVKAGCDVVCYCGGRMDDLQMLARDCPEMTDKAQERYYHIIDNVLQNRATPLNKNEIRFYNQSVGQIEEYNEHYDATEILNLMQKKNRSLG